MLDVLYKYNKYCGIWPDNNRMWDVIKVIIHIVSTSYLLIGMILFMFKVFLDPTATVLNVTDAIYTVQSAINFFFSYVGCVLVRKPSLEFFENISNVHIFGVPRALYEMDAQINRNVKLLIGYGTVAPIFVSLYYFATYNSCLKQQEEAGSLYYCGFLYGLCYPYSHDKGISFIIHVIITTYAYTLLCIDIVIFVCAVYCAIEYIIIKIEHLNIMLDEVTKVENQEMMLQDLKTCIKYHIHIISLVDEFNSCYSIISTPATFAYSVTLGICFSSLAKKLTIKAVLMIAGYITGISLLTLSGQKLIDVASILSESIGLAAYNVNWYDMNLEAKKCIFLMIIRSQRPLTYKSGPFGTFSVLLLVNIVRGSYTYMTMQTNIQ